MDTASVRACVLWAALVGVPIEALAQSGPAPPAEPFRKWDLGGDLGLRFGQPPHTAIPDTGFSASVGHYWTAHLKTEAALTTTGWGSSEEPVEYLPDGGYRDTRLLARPPGLSVGATYQFGDNAFVHPYVSGAMCIARVEQIRTTMVYSPMPRTTTVRGPSSTAQEALVAGGLKSYFRDGRTFMRSEFGLAVGPHGSSHVVVRIGVGIDF